MATIEGIGPAKVHLTPRKCVMLRQKTNDHVCVKPRTLTESRRHARLGARHGQGWLFSTLPIQQLSRPIERLLLMSNSADITVTVAVGGFLHHAVPSMSLRCMVTGLIRSVGQIRTCTA